MQRNFSHRPRNILSVILAIVMIITAVPMTASSATVNEDGYIEIRTIEELYGIRNDLTANYILMNDIDLTEATALGGDWDFGGRGWNPIGSGDTYSRIAFSGIFDGNGYAIIGMRIETTSSFGGHVGLFTSVTGEVCNLEMRDVNIINNYSSSDHYTGAVAAYNDGTITNCTVSGSVKGKSYVGGIVGYNDGTITKCYNTAAVTASSDYCGGIAGYNLGVTCTIVTT